MDPQPLKDAVPSPVPDPGKPSAGGAAGANAGAEKPLEVGRALLQEVLDHLPDAVYVKDAQGRYVVGNAAHKHALGLQSDAQAAGTSVFNYFPRDQAERFAADDRAVLQTGEPLIGREERVTRPGGGDAWVVTSKVPLRNNDGRVVGLLAISRDVTDRRRTEEQLREADAALRRREEELLRAMDELRASAEKLAEARLQVAQMEKMRSVGRLAAGVAHEVKNPLGIIAMGLSFLSRCPPCPNPDADREAAEVRRMMNDALNRADGVIRGLLDFAAPSRLRLEPRDLNQLVRRSLSLVAHDLTARRVSAETELADGLPALSLDGVKVEQVLINLFTNAAHAMAGGGTLTVRTRAAAADTGTGANAGTGTGPFAVVVVVEVDDTGPGIPEDLLPRVFDPFVTTKSADTGTGLGLTVTRTIVELHGGRIDIRNRPEGGARATLTFRCPGLDREPGLPVAAP